LNYFRKKQKYNVMKKKLNATMEKIKKHYKTGNGHYLFSEQDIKNIKELCTHGFLEHNSFGSLQPSNDGIDTLVFLCADPFTTEGKRYLNMNCWKKWKENNSFIDISIDVAGILGFIFAIIIGVFQIQEGCSMNNIVKQKTFSNKTMIKDVNLR